MKVLNLSFTHKKPCHLPIHSYVNRIQPLQILRRAVNERKPEESTSELDYRQKVDGVFFKSTRPWSEVFQFVDHPLDEFALVVDSFANSDESPPYPFSEE